MNTTQLICLANSSKYKERCIAGISPESKSWIRPVSPDFPDTGKVSAKTLIKDGSSVLTLEDIKPLSILEIPLDKTGPDFGFQSENRTVLPGDWMLIGKARIDEILPFVNFKSQILHDGRKYVSVPNLQALPFEKRRTLEVVYTDSLQITLEQRSGGGNKWKGSFRTRGGYSYNKITITDSDYFDLLDRGIYPSNTCLITMSLGMPYTPPGWDGPKDPSWKLIAGIIELSLDDQILVEMHLATWDIERGKDYVTRTFNKNTRANLTSEEKISFIKHLKNQSRVF